jgi:uncharacterized alkaline shock family protein YloU
MSDAVLVHDLGGSVTVSSAALQQVVVQAAESVDGARVRRPRRGLDIELADGRAHVELELAARYGAVLPELARETQERVAAALASMCGVEVEAVDVSIEELDG